MGSSRDLTSLGFKPLKISQQYLMLGLALGPGGPFLCLLPSRQICHQLAFLHINKCPNYFQTQLVGRGGLFGLTALEASVRVPLFSSLGVWSDTLWPEHTAKAKPLNLLYNQEAKDGREREIIRESMKHWDSTVLLQRTPSMTQKNFTGPPTPKGFHTSKQHQVTGHTPNSWAG